MFWQMEKVADAKKGAEVLKINSQLDLMKYPL
jgi:hypothetical protein